MKKIVMAEHAEGFYAAFDDKNPNRAQPGDVILLSGLIKLSRDMVVDVPVTIVMYGEESGISCGEYHLRCEWKIGADRHGRCFQIKKWPLEAADNKK